MWNKGIFKNIFQQKSRKEKAKIYKKKDGDSEEKEHCSIAMDGAMFNIEEQDTSIPSCFKGERILSSIVAGDLTFDKQKRKSVQKP